MRLRTIALALSITFTASSCRQGSSPNHVAQAGEIAWREGDVDNALAEAKEAGKPVILYWGADWCPPCAQMKATLFKDPAFIAETEKFIPVYLNGDTQGAQRWAERFGTTGYPTVVLLRSDGTEITRIANTAMASELPELLRTAASRTTSIEALLKKAAIDPSALEPVDWRILAGFDWRNDPKHFGELKAGSLLERLAEAAPDPMLRRRFALLALVESVEPGPQGMVAMTKAQQERLSEILPPILATRGEVMANRWELITDVPGMVVALPPGAKRDSLEKSMVAAADSIYANPNLALIERLNSLNVELTFALSSGKPPSPALVSKVRERVAWADRTATDKMTRQSVIGAAAGMLSIVDPAGTGKMLLAEIKRSDQPYYYMTMMATGAELGGDKRAAIEWSRKAYEASEGPATRVQWAVKYAKAVIRFTPEDKAAVAKAAEAAITELGKSPDSYYQNTRKSVTSLGESLREWSQAHNGVQVLAGLQAKMDRVCARQGARASACSSWAEG